jgi:hypothetical protein
MLWKNQQCSFSRFTSTLKREAAYNREALATAYKPQYGMTHPHSLKGLKQPKAVVLNLCETGPGKFFVYKTTTRYRPAARRLRTPRNPALKHVIWKTYKYNTRWRESSLSYHDDYEWKDTKLAGDSNIVVLLMNSCDIF